MAYGSIYDDMDKNDLSAFKQFMHPKREVEEE